jgi:hypothetical protein
MGNLCYPRRIRHRAHGTGDLSCQHWQRRQHGASARTANPSRSKQRLAMLPDNSLSGNAGILRQPPIAVLWFCSWFCRCAESSGSFRAWQGPWFWPNARSTIQDLSGGNHIAPRPGSSAHRFFLNCHARSPLCCTPGRWAQVLVGARQAASLSAHATLNSHP